MEDGGSLWLLIDIFLDFWQNWRHPYIIYDVNRLLSVWLLKTDTYFLNMALKISNCYCDRKGKLRFQFWALTFALIYQMCNEKRFLSSWPKSTFSPLHEVLFWWVKKRVNLSGGPPDECLHGAPPTIKKLKTAADDVINIFPIFHHYDVMAVGK